MRFLRKVYRKFFGGDQLKGLIRSGLVVGKNFQMQNEVLIDRRHCWHITIGDDVTLAPRVHILAHDASTKRYLNYTKIGKVTIGNRVFIGASAVILPGVTIGDDVIVGVGSVVNRDIPSGTVAVGNPAKEIGATQEYISRRKAELEKYPCFGEEFTARRGVTDAMKSEMNDKMVDGYGYII
jgi:maltose O-acetyltransferase